MRVRVACVLLLAAVGCESLRPPVPQEPPPQLPAMSAKPQAASGAEPHAKPPAASVVPASASEPVRLTPKQEDDPLTLMSDCLRRDDVRGAALHLDDYVRANPDQYLFRLQLAELYLRAEQPAEAKFHYERFAADAQSGPATIQPHLVTAHTKLMQIAQNRNDRFGELFHRGVGLLLLLKQLDGVKGRDEGFREELLCKALAALTEAKELKPRDPRVRVYLAEVQERAGNPRAANAERKGARGGVTSGELSETERKGLLLEGVK